MAGLREIAAKRQQQKGLMALRKERSTNGAASKPQGLVAIRAAKAAQREAAQASGLLALRNARRARKKGSSRLDFSVNGLRYHNARIVDFAPRPWGRIDITNGDTTYTFTNQYGSWMSEVGKGRLREPAAVARMLGTTASQYEVASSLQDRWYAELKFQGVPTPEERIRQREEAERATRKGKRGRKNVDNTEET